MAARPVRPGRHHLRRLAGILLDGAQHHQLGPDSHHAAETGSTRGVVPGSDVKTPLSMRPNPKAWTSRWSPSPATDSTWHVEKTASWASASLRNWAVCVRSTWTSRPFAADSSRIRAVAAWFPA